VFFFFFKNLIRENTQATKHYDKNVN